MLDLHRESKNIFIDWFAIFYFTLVFIGQNICLNQTHHQPERVVIFKRNDGDSLSRDVNIY